MDYFVSIENCQYFRWQLELLYESMRLLGLEDSLAIACAPLDTSAKPLRFKRVFYHENMGRNNNYLALNKPYSLLHALKSEFIKQPFVVIDPDMVMLKPIEIEDKSAANYVDWLEYDNLHKCGYTLDIPKKDWRPGACVYFFNNCPMSVFEEIYEQTYKMIFQYDEKDGKLRSEVDYWQREMVAFAIGLSRVGANLRDDYQAFLDARYQDVNFIHYCNGYQPYFNKRFHNDLREFTLGPALPFEAIASIPKVNLAIKFRNITKSFLDRHKGMEI